MIRYYITHRKGTPDFIANVKRLVSKGAVDWIQVREKDLSARDLLELTMRIVQIARPHGIQVLVNERADVALAAGADGVHLPSNALPPSALRKLSVSMKIGVSCHDQEELAAAAAEKADFAVLGPVFAPISKEVSGPPLGLQEFARLASTVTIPVLALGGITSENSASCLTAGAAGIAGISLFL